MRSVLLFVFLLASLPATAEEPADTADPPTLPTTLASELLGEDFMGLPMPDAHMWSGKLVELAELFFAWLTHDEVSLTVGRRGTGPIQLRWTLVGEPIPIPEDWSDLGITIEPFLAELREQLGIQVLGERLVLPRHVVVRRAADLRTMRPKAAGSGIVLGHEVPRSPATLLELLDLQRGDINQSFNALPLDTTEALHDLVRAFHALRTITVEIRRGDSIVTRRYDIAGDPVEPDDLLFHTGRSLRRP